MTNLKIQKQGQFSKTHIKFIRIQSTHTEANRTCFIAKQTHPKNLEDEVQTGKSMYDVHNTGSLIEKLVTAVVCFKKQTCPS